MVKAKSELPIRRYGDVVPKIQELDQIAISTRSHKLLKQLLKENPIDNEIPWRDFLEGKGKS